jgi:putative flippase GtrA
MGDRTIVVNQASEQGLMTLHSLEMEEWQAQCVALEAHAVATPLIAQAPPATKERANLSAARYLPDRSIIDQEAVLALLRRLDVPFGNNQAERVVCTVKAQQKITGSSPPPIETVTPLPSLLNTPTIGVLATQSDKVPTIYSRLLQLFKKRFWGFGLVGLGVMLCGMILMYVLVKLCGIDQNIAYFVQAVAAIEASFLLNRFINWRDRSGKLYIQWIKFHTTKIGTVILNQILFGIIVALGFHYLLATLIGVGVATIINYVTNDRLVFAPRKWERMPTQRLRSYRLDVMPNVGVVIPVRNSHRTIRQCVESALEQDYRGEFTIFIVGNSVEQDTTWEALGDLTQHFRVKCLYISRPSSWVGRDANMKRYFGCMAATNAGFDVIAFLDSQVMAPTNWLSSALQQMHEKCVDGVAGISCRNPEDCSMSGIYQDGSLFSEWPRYGLGYFLSKETFGQAKGLVLAT